MSPNHVSRSGDVKRNFASVRLSEVAFSGPQDSVLPSFLMQFALLGDMSEAVWLTDGLLREESLQLQHCCVSPALAGRLSDSGHSFVLTDAEADAFLADDVDAVIVAWSDAERSIESCRRVSQEGRLLLVFLPHNVSTAFSYELLIK